MLLGSNTDNNGSIIVRRPRISLTVDEVIEHIPYLLLEAETGGTPPPPKKLPKINKLNYFYK